VVTARNRCKLAILALLLATLAFPSACSKGEPPEIPGLISEDLRLEEAFALIEDNRYNDDFIIIDLRSAEEYASGHIEDAINLDYNSPDFAGELEELDRDKAYLLCSYTDEVSGQVLDMMAGLGFSEVYNLIGGIERWRQTGLFLVK
jgi:rhodanese-related sulfurtransferase